MTFPHLRATLFLVVFSMILLPSAGVAQKPSKDEERVAILVDRTKKAVAVIKAVADLPEDKGIPREITKAMNMIGIIPDAWASSLLFSKGMKGRGVSSSMQNGAWSLPAFYAFGQANGIDFSGGISSRHFDIVMVVVDADLRTKKEKKDDKKKEKTAPPRPKPQSYVYTFADGVLKPIKLKTGILDAILGAQVFLMYDDKLNKAAYGTKGDDVLLGKIDAAKQILPELSAFQTALTELYPSK